MNEGLAEGQIFDFDYPVEPDIFDPAQNMERSLQVGIGTGALMGIVAAGIANKEVLSQMIKTMQENPSPEGIAGGLLLVPGGLYGAFLGIGGGVVLGSIRHHWHYDRVSFTS